MSRLFPPDWIGFAPSSSDYYLHRFFVSLSPMGIFSLGRPKATVLGARPALVRGCLDPDLVLRNCACSVRCGWDFAPKSDMLPYEVLPAALLIQL